MDRRMILGMLAAALGTPALAAVEGPSEEAIRGAMERGLVRVQAAAENYPSHRDCFSCHHQTLPAMAMVAAREAGATIDEEILASAVEFTSDSFSTHTGQLERGRGIGGGSMTVGYGLWTFEEGGRKPDTLSDAMVIFLLKNQEDSGRWESNTGRPPLEGSHVTCTTLAAYGLDRFAPLPYRSLAKEAVAKAKDWIASAEPADQEDRAARLWGLWLLDADEGAIEAARSDVLAAQRDDGGWSQLDDPEMAPDAYATGQSLTILARTGLSTDDPAYRRGLQFLVKTQCDDGSWKVESRARHFQAMFDNGDPHGESQFISTAATSWAVAALAEAQSGR